MRSKIVMLLAYLVLIQFLNSRAQTPPDTSRSSANITVSGALSPSNYTTKPLILVAGDSVFVYGGELYYRARVGGKDYFISQKELAARADSLVVYQNYRLFNDGSKTSEPESTTVRIQRQRCVQLTRDGARCKRLALPNADRCWQHKK